MKIFIKSMCCVLCVPLSIKYMKRFTFIKLENYVDNQKHIVTLNSNTRFLFRSLHSKQQRKKTIKFIL